MRSDNQLSGRLPLAALVLATLVAGSAPVWPADLCSRVSLSPRPTWLSAAMWLPPASGILAVDSATNRLLLYAPDGKGRTLAQPENQLPALLAAAGDHILLNLVNRDAVRLDPRDLEDPQPRADAVLKNVQTPFGPLTAIYQLAGVDQSLLIVGLVMRKNLPDGFQTGLFRLSTATGAHDAELLRTIPSWHHYVLGYNYLTSIGATGYFLDMNPDYGTARLFEVPPGGAARELLDRSAPPKKGEPPKSSVPAEVAAVPRIDATMYGPKDAPPLFAKLAQTRMTTGIYAGPDGNLYLLGREPAPNGGGNDWWLFRISSKTGTLLGKAHLPSKAQHLSIVTSPDTFYLVERGAADPYGGQQINSMVTAPASLIEGASQQGSEVCPGLRK